jgi:hypothetical protein
METFKQLSASPVLQRNRHFEFVGFDGNTSAIAHLMRSSLCVLHWNLVSHYGHFQYI